MRRIRQLGGEPDLAGAEGSDGLEARLAAIKQDLVIEIESYEIDPVTGEARDALDEPRREMARTVTDLGFRVTSRGWGFEDEPA